MKTQKVIINDKEIDLVIELDDDYVEYNEIFNDDDTLDLSNEINKLKEMTTKNE